MGEDLVRIHTTFCVNSLVLSNLGLLQIVRKLLRVKF